MQRNSDEYAVQLYSIRDAVANDLEASLERVAALGYRGVELAGWAGARPERWSDLLLRHHLTPVAMHVPYEALQDVEGASAEASVIGVSTLVLPWLPESVRKTAADWTRAAEWMNHIGERARLAGKRLAYHNHAFEFDPLPEGGTGYDRLLEYTDPALVEFELDLYWAMFARQSLPDLIRRLGRRLTLAHIKDMKPEPDRGFAPVGHGVLDWSGLLPQLKTEWLIVEQDACDAPDPFTCLEQSYTYLAGRRT